ncbi:baseplate J/gp47 family protein [Castellaniella caeni]|uniref:baseplate J/gp47 family protein n=1 Tax=Castellaniella caeni TaxID=266123 RepID=UPI000C9EEB9F|nr:baseplate J/gp47 family protein [Castellaniella caeni]
MPFTTPAFTDIRAAYLRDLRNMDPLVDTASDSDAFVRGSALGSAVEGLYQHQGWITRQIFPDTADPEILERHAATRGLRLKPAVSSAGLLSATGTPGVTLLPGLTFTAADGRQYVVTDATEIPPLGAINVPARALVAGIAGNAPAGLAGVWSLAPAGLDSNAEIVEMIGGADGETHASLLDRLLFLIRRPPAGGNKYDYIRWARDVPGVSQAYSYPLRRGLGTIDVAIVTEGGLPSAETIQAAQDYIESVRPVTAKNCLVIAPDLVTTDVVVQVRRSGVTLPIATSAIDGVLLAQFAGLAPGVTWVRSQAEGQVSALAGIVDRNIITPVANVVPVVDATTVQWIQAGTLTVEDMP